MLTVKHIETTGHETIWPAIRVTFQPKMNFQCKPIPEGCDAAGDRAPVIWIDRMGERGLVDTINIGSTGSFYVMNEHGKTIAKYDLGGWDAPKAQQPKTFTITPASPDHAGVVITT